MMSKLNFTLIYSFNFINSQYEFINCDDLNPDMRLTIKIVSQIIGYSQELAPFL